MKKQLSLLKNSPKEFGGKSKFNPKNSARPLSTKNTMHLILKSSKAKGDWSFLKKKKGLIKEIKTYADKNHIKIIGLAIHINHIHLHIKLRHRLMYKKFIKAITSIIMMKVTGFSRWKKKPKNLNFWDYRPFSKIVTCYTYFQNMVKYIQINILETKGMDRSSARLQLDLVEKLCFQSD